MPHSKGSKQMKYLYTVMISSLFSGVVYANDASVGPVIVESVAIISDWATHKSGSLEIKIKDGFSLPDGLTCTDSNYITTLKSVEAFPYMLAALLSAQSKGQNVILGITDEPSRNAYSSRCSLKYVNVM
jgi:hypothetical protein